MASRPLCSITDCNKPVHRRGLCGTHFWRLKTHGDPNYGGRIKEYGKPRRYFEEVVIGFSGTECLFWPYSKSCGYGVVPIDGTLYLVHRRACEITHGPPPTPEHEAAHSCGNGHLGCCNPKHIRWATPSENQADRLLHGTDGRGEKHHAAKLTEDDVREIRYLSTYTTHRMIARIFGISRWTVADILRGKIWGWLR